MHLQLSVSVCVCVSVGGDRVLGFPARVARMLFCLAINIAKGAHSPPLKCLPSANCQRESQPQQLPNLFTLPPSVSVSPPRDCIVPFDSLHFHLQLPLQHLLLLLLCFGCTCSQSAPSCLRIGFVSSDAPFIAGGAAPWRTRAPWPLGFEFHAEIK